jgi:hypothetical protein
MQAMNQKSSHAATASEVLKPQTSVSIHLDDMSEADRNSLGSKLINSLGVLGCA